MTSEEIEAKLRKVDYCVIPQYPGDKGGYANRSLTLHAARMLKRQRKEIADLMAELAYHGVYPQ